MDYFRYSLPAAFHKKLLSYNWSKIYTVNIDDIIEKVYSDNGVEILLQNSKIKSTLNKVGVTEVIKLHGCVNNPSDGVTFSTQQYIESMLRGNDYRFRSLGLDMQNRPIIILGATFDEINIDYYLRLYENAGYTTLRGNIFLINPNPPLLNSKKIEKLGGFIIKWTTEEFLNFIHEKFKKGIPKKLLIEKNLIQQGFFEIDKIKTKLIPEKKYTGSLYWGYNPKWEDVYYEWDFRNYEVENAINKVLEKFENNQVAIISLVGKVLSGKTVLLKRIAANLEKGNYKVLYFKGYFFDAYYLRRALSDLDHNNFVLIVDDASYNYASIKRLIKNLDQNIKLRVITASKPHSHYRFRYQFVGYPFFEVELGSKLTKAFSLDIANKLDEKGYLGGLKKMNDPEDRARIIYNQKDLVSFLYSNSYGKGFKKRFTLIVDKARVNDETKDLLTALSIFNSLELPYMPYELASMLFPDNIEKYLHELSDLLKETNTSRLELRTDFISKYFLTKVPNWKKVEILKSILVIISPLIIDFEQSYWNEIQANLIKEKFLRIRLKLKTDEIRQMLYDIRSYYSNDFNYWIQLGIAEQIKNDFEKAFNHFKTAESINDNSYLVKNSIGRNYLKHARYIDNKEVAIISFQQGEQILLKLIREEEEYKARAYASHSYLSESMLFYEKNKELLTTEIVQKLGKVLDYMLDKDPEDPMTMEINNKFISFLKRNKKLHLFTYSFKDLKKLKPMFYDYYIDEDNSEFD